MNTTPRPIAVLLQARAFGILARTVLTAPYWSSGLMKFADLDGAYAEAAHFGLQPTGLVVAATIFVQVGGSLLLILNRLGWLAAGALGMFTAIATLIGHRFWEIADPIAAFHDRNSFIEHVGLIGGFMLAAILTEQEKAR